MCGGIIFFQEKEIRGLGFKPEVACNKCKKCFYFGSSPATGSKMNVYKVNIRSILDAQMLRVNSMKNAAKKEISLTPEDQDGLDVSGDRTWQTPGFFSFKGVTTLIGYRCGKVIDVLIKNSYFKSCEFWENKKETPEYDDWFEKLLPCES